MKIFHPIMFIFIIRNNGSGTSFLGLEKIVCITTGTQRGT